MLSGGLLEQPLDELWLEVHVRATGRRFEQPISDAPSVNGSDTVLRKKRYARALATHGHLSAHGGSYG